MKIGDTVYVMNVSDRVYAEPIGPFIIVKITASNYGDKIINSYWYYDDVKYDQPILMDVFEHDAYHTIEEVHEASVKFMAKQKAFLETQMHQLNVKIQSINDHMDYLKK